MWCAYYIYIYIYVNDVYLTRHQAWSRAKIYSAGLKVIHGIIARRREPGAGTRLREGSKVIRGILGRRDLVLSAGSKVIRGIIARRRESLGTRLDFCLNRLSKDIDHNLCMPAPE